MSDTRRPAIRLWPAFPLAYGRLLRAGRRDGKVLVESAPSVVADLARRIALITSPVDGRHLPAVDSVDHLTREAGQAQDVQGLGGRGAWNYR
ncbi:hypothetical protein [Salinispora arenicola]|uniref:hypothetical protein n=1 Tax=Salinispora arenicola TaxID=168697 RepID=UPI0004ACB73F|nr:hypothetical protein [Salinispora arenicola]